MLALWNWLAPWALFLLAALWQIVDHAARLLLVGMLLRRFWDEEVDDGEDDKAQVSRADV